MGRRLLCQSPVFFACDDPFCVFEELIQYCFKKVTKGYKNLLKRQNICYNHFIPLGKGK